jgi:23S rRNA (guanosine2251-2'-O)-methyltransferase
VKLNNNLNNIYNKLYGINTILALIETDPSKIIEIFCEKKEGVLLNPKITKICDIATKQQISVQYMRKGSLDKWFGEVNHQGIAANIKPPTFLAEKDLINLLKTDHNAVFLVLDNIQDPRNLGACIRSAAAFKVSAVIISKNASCGITAAVKKVASGACEHVSIAIVGNLAACLKQLKQHGVWVAALAMNHETPLSSIDLTMPIALVLGSEQHGVRRIIKEASDFLAYIPMPNKSIESLNLSVAAGICLYEAIRQRS